MESSEKFLYPQLEHLGSATVFIEDIFDVIEHIPLFGGLSYPEIEQIAAYMECFGAPAGTRLLEEGEAGDYLLLILTGVVEVTKVGSGGSARGVAVVGPGGTLGEMSLVDGARRNASCVTIEPCDFAVLTRSSLNALLASHPALGAKLLLVLLTGVTNRLRQANERLLPHIQIPAV